MWWEMVCYCCCNFVLWSFILKARFRLRVFPEVYFAFKLGSVVQALLCCKKGSKVILVYLLAQSNDEHVVLSDSWKIILFQCDDFMKCTYLCIDLSYSVYVVEYSVLLYAWCISRLRVSWVVVVLGQKVIFTN